jgi:hypothetical protein
LFSWLQAGKSDVDVLELERSLLSAHLVTIVNFGRSAGRFETLQWLCCTAVKYNHQAFGIVFDSCRCFVELV